MSANAKRLLIILAVIFLAAPVPGFAGQKTKPEDPVKKSKEEFLLRYGFFVTRDADVVYYRDDLGLTGRENKIFNGLKTIEEVEKFKDIFFKVRDPDPNTPENEFKDIVDQRIEDIENEIFATDIDIPGTRFANNGGLRGDLAHVYLLYGTPHYKFRLAEGRNHVELKTWYYIDVRGKALFRFLFLDHNGPTRLYKNHVAMLKYEDLFNPFFSPLRDISTRPAPGPEDLWELWRELEASDQEGVFRAALFQFSYYDDVTVDNALSAPEPAALTAARLKPSILGQPEDLSNREFLRSSYHSFIPVDLKITDDRRLTFVFKILYRNIDWEIKGENAEAILSLRISFQNTKTKEIKEFFSTFSIPQTRADIERKRDKLSLEIPADNLMNHTQAKEDRKNLRQLIDSLEPGKYIVNIDLTHQVTKKSNGGLREEIVIN